MTTKELATKLNVTTQTIYNYTRGIPKRRKPVFEFGVDYEYDFKGKIDYKDSCIDKVNNYKNINYRGVE